MARDKWSSRTTFIMAAIASAIGLGNIWRFPGIVYQNGGGAFLIPFLVALLTAGIPLLAMELALGKKFRAGSPTALKNLNKNFEWIGWLGVGTAFCIATYYSVVLAWVINYVGLSFTSPWISKSSAQVFLHDTLQISPSMFELNGFNWFILIALAIGWFLIWYCLRNGVQSVGKILNYVVTLPIILLTILIIRSISLPGALEGIQYYIIPDWSKLLDARVWAAAYGQVFFSLSILFSIMVAYGSYLPDESQVTKDSLIVAFSDAAVSLFAGFAAFGTLGYLSNLTSTPIAEMNHSGMMLAFVTYPAAIAAMPGGKIMVILFSLTFFILLLTLALGSAFSIVEAIITAIVDKFGFNKKKTTLAVCVVGLFASLIFATKAGLYWVDIVDHFINDFNLILIGFFETVALAWIFGADKVLDMINEGCSYKFGKTWSFCVKYVCPVVFLFISASYLVTNIKTPYGGYPLINLIVGGWMFVAATFVFSIIMTCIKGKKTEMLQDTCKTDKITTTVG